ILQCFEQMEPGPILVDDWRFVLPPKNEGYSTIEGLIAHFKIVLEGVKIPAVTVHSFSESPNGEVGGNVVTDGAGWPCAVDCRIAGTPLLGGLEHMVVGSLLRELIPTFELINMISGEVEQ